MDEEDIRCEGEGSAREVEVDIKIFEDEEVESGGSETCTADIIEL